MKLSRLLALILTSLALATSWAQSPSKPVRKATTTGPDMTGLWHVPAETGWGVNVIQQNKTMLVTLFVYGNNGKPTWFVGPDVGLVSTDSGGGATFAGALYQTSGPHFAGGGYDSSAVQMEIVGTVTLRFANPGEGVLTYTANGSSVTKSIVAYTFRVNDLTGLYVGSAAAPYNLPQCVLPLPSGDFDLVAFDIAQSGSSMIIQLQDLTLATCTLTGQLTPQGKQSEVNGTYTCTGGASGRFAIRRMEAGVDGFSGAYYGLSNPSCANVPVTIGAARAP